MMSCKAPGFSQSESDSTLEDSAIREEATSQLDYEEAYEQLERMKQRVLQMKSMILGVLEPTDPCEPSTDAERLGEIQLETSRACQQIDAVRSCLKESNEELNSLSERIQESGCCTKKLAKKLEEVPKWMDEQRHHVGVCLERYNELDTTYCNYLEYSIHMRPILKGMKSRLGVKIPLKCYKLDYMNIQAKLSQSRNLLHHTRKKLFTNLRALENTLTSKEPQLDRLPSESTDLAKLFQKQDSPRRSSQGPRRHSERHSWNNPLPKITHRPLLTVHETEADKN